jgi:hypothetical protein
VLIKQLLISAQGVPYPSNNSCCSSYSALHASQISVLLLLLLLLLP